MPRIIPIRDLRDTTKLSEMCNGCDEPIYITKNGYGDMVVMSMATYDGLLAKLEMYSKIMEGKSQADNGELLSADEFMAEMKSKNIGEAEDN